MELRARSSSGTSALEIGNGSVVGSDTIAAGDAGPVVVAADEIAVTDNSQIRSDTFGSGDAGPVTIDVGRLLVRDGNDDQVQTGILSDAETN